MGNYRGVRGGRREREKILLNKVLEPESNQELLMHQFPLRVLRGDSSALALRVSVGIGSRLKPGLQWGDGVNQKSDHESNLRRRESKE
jgi:hypothetical protein